MADEKRIERWEALLCSSSAHVVTERDGDGEFVRYDDHLDALGEARLEAGDLRVELELAESARLKAEEALGEAERKLTEEQQRMVISRNRISGLEEDLEEADGKLETLRSGLKALISSTEAQAREWDRPGDDAAELVNACHEEHADYLRELLDVSEDTEKQSCSCPHGGHSTSCAVHGAWEPDGVPKPQFDTEKQSGGGESCGDDDMAFVGRCADCGKLHAVIVVNPQTAKHVSETIKEWEKDGMTTEQMTVAAARPEFTMCSAGEASS